MADSKCIGALDNVALNQLSSFYGGYGTRSADMQDALGADPTGPPLLPYGIAF